jgi:hypothetical protein
MITIDQAIERLYLVAEGKRKHKHYDRTVKVAKECYTLATGDGMERLMKRFARRESPELFKQRCEITAHIIKPVIQNVSDVFKKVYRSDYLRMLEYTGDESNVKTAFIEGKMSSYYADQSLDGWLQTRLLELNVVDPNAWIVTEWAAFDENITVAKPYPFEVSSENALDYELDTSGNLLYLIVATLSGKKKENGDPLLRYTAYLPNQSVSIDEVENVGGILGLVAKNVGDKHFETVIHTPHNIGYVPAVRAGYMRDKVTQGETFVSIYDAAIPFFMKTIKVNSELDLTAALHAFPLVIRVGEDCDAEGCNGGTIYADEGNHPCGACSGTGKKRPTSTQEEIVVSMPRNPEDVIDLSRLYTFVTPPVEIIRWQSEYVDALTKKCLSVIFNSEIFTQSEVTATATEKNIDLQSVYDTLYPYALKWSASWKFLVVTYAKVIRRDKGLNASILIRRDFKLRSYDMLIGDLANANTTGASPVIRASIESDLANVMFADAPGKMLRYVVRESLNPFSGMSAANVSYMLASDLVPRRKKVLYANLGWLLDEIEADLRKSGVNFYTLAPDRQVEIVDAKLDLITEEVQPATPVFEA